MKLLSNPLLALLPLLTLFGPCLAAESEGALERVYLFALYDFEATVWGVGKGYIATKCRGTVLPDKRCNLNEFINFLEFGTAANSPSYYDLASDFYLTAGSLQQIVQALSDIVDRWGDDVWGRAVTGRKSFVGLWNDVGQAFARTSARAADLGRSVGREMGNAKLVLGEVSRARAGPVNARMFTTLRNNIQDIVFASVERSVAWNKWQEIDWERTIRLNPTLMDPNSDASKVLFNTVNNFYTLPENARALTINTKVGDTLRTCYA
ncbi:hypothetical protein EsH8_VIII_000921 [Colletotrichum jinshuiense]